MACPAQVRVPSPSPAYPGVYRPDKLRKRVYAGATPARLFVWERLEQIWAEPAYVKFNGLPGRPMSRAGRIGALLGMRSRLVRLARLDQPHRWEAWWASYSNLYRALNAVAKRATGESAGAHRPVQGAKGQVPSLPGEYARLFCQPAVAGDPGSPARLSRQRASEPAGETESRLNGAPASAVTVRRKAATAITADNPTKGGRESSRVTHNRDASSCHPERSAAFALNEGTKPRRQPPQIRAGETGGTRGPSRWLPRAVKDTQRRQRA